MRIEDYSDKIEEIIRGMIGEYDKVVQDRYKVLDRLKATTARERELKKALQACVDVMADLPTLNGFEGLAVLENAKEVLKKYNSEKGE